MSRRFLAAVPVALAFRTAAGEAARPADLPLLQIAGGRAALRFETGGPELTMPADEARIAAVLTLAGQSIAAVSFAAPLRMGSRGEMLALIGADGDRLRFLGVELLNWRSPGGAALGTRLSATTDGTRVRLDRVSTRPRAELPPLHEAWIDYLRWDPGAPLQDAPIHPVVAGTCQSALAITRTRVTAALTSPCRNIDLSWLDGAGLLAPPF